MGKCWMFEEIDEYSPLALKIISHDFKTIQSVEKEKLKLTEFSSNPLEPIVAISNQMPKGYFTVERWAHEMFDAIQESVRRTEGGE